jgi:hypothetical protein
MFCINRIKQEQINTKCEEPLKKDYCVPILFSMSIQVIKGCPGDIGKIFQNIPLRKMLFFLDIYSLQNILYCSSLYNNIYTCTRWVKTNLNLCTGRSGSLHDKIKFVYLHKTN